MWPFSSRNLGKLILFGTKFLTSDRNFIPANKNRFSVPSVLKFTLVVLKFMTFTDRKFLKCFKLINTDKHKNLSHSRFFFFQYLDSLLTCPAGLTSISMYDSKMIINYEHWTKYFRIILIVFLCRIYTHKYKMMSGSHFFLCELSIFFLCER